MNEAFAARLPPGTGAIGSTVQVRQNVGDPGWRRAEIVGVVEDSYERVPRGRARPRCYLPLDSSWSGDSFTLFARSLSAAALVPRVQELMGAVHPGLSARAIGTVAALVREEYRWLSWVTEILAAVSALALGLAAVGLFGLISHAVSQRTREFGVRLALGAHPRTIMSGVIREALTLTLSGLALGFAFSIPIALILSDGVLHTISWLDPVPAVAVGLVLIAVAVLASLAPARRVLRLDPVWALRQE